MTADIMFSQLPNASPLNGNEIVPIIQGGQNVKANIDTGAQIKANQNLRSTDSVNFGIVTGRLSFGSGLTNIDIVNGVVTLPNGSSAIRLTGENGTHDNLETINGGNGSDVCIFRNGTTSLDITFKHNIGNIRCNGGVDITLNDTNEFAFAIRHAHTDEWLVSKAWDT